MHDSVNGVTLEPLASVQAILTGNPESNKSENGTLTDTGIVVLFSPRLALMRVF
jgi:hypothetical protein